MASRRRSAALAVLSLAVFAALVLLRAVPLTSPEPGRPDADAGRRTSLTVATAPAGTRIERGGVVEGRVLRGGAGVEARVEARTVDHQDGLHRGPVAGAAASGAGGMFRIEGLAPGRYEIRAVGADRTVGEAQAVIAATGARVRVRIELPAGEFSLSARAVWADGRPFRGLVRGTAWTETTAAGGFRIRGLDAGAHPLRFLIPGAFRSGGHHVVVPADREHVLVVDEGAAALAGRVVAAADGAPVAGALVSVSGNGPQYSVAAARRVRTDADGRFRARVPATRRWLNVTAEGYRPCGWHWWPEDGEDFEIRLDRAHRVTGRVVTEAGEPVAGLEVIGAPRNISEPAVRGVSGEDGRFALEGLGAGNVVVYARGRGWLSRHLGAAIRNRGAPLARPVGPGIATDVRVVVVRSAVVEGRVTDPDGRPVSGAVVRAELHIKEGRQDGTLRREMVVEAATAADGRFRAPDQLPETAYNLTVTAPGFLPGIARTAPAIPGATTSAEIVLTPCPRESISPLDDAARHETPLSIAGSVLFPDGSPASHGQVTTRQAIPGAKPRSTPIGAGGLFRIGGHPAGPCEVEALAFRGDRPYAGTALVKAGDEAVEIVLSPKPEAEPDGQMVVALRVVDPEGRPVPDADIYCVETGDRGDNGVAGVPVYRGQAWIPLDHGTRHYWFRVSAPCSLSGAPLPLGPAVFGPLPAQAGEMEVRLPAERVISGLVVDEAGRGIAGAPVGCFVPGDLGSPLRDSTPGTFTDDRGRFRIGGLAAGDYLLSAGGGAARTIVRAGSGEVVLTIRSPVSVRIQVLGADGSPVAGEEVRVGDTKHHAKTDASGEARLTGLTPGRSHVLLVGALSHPHARIDPWIPQDTTIRLPEPLSVEGTVFDEKGKPSPDPEIWFLAAGGRWEWISPDREGRFRIGPLPPGPVRLLALPGDVAPRAADSRAVTVRAGAKGVRVVRRPGAAIRFRIRDWPEGKEGGASLFDAAGRLAGEAGIDEDGTGEIVGVDERGVFTLWVHPLDDGRTLQVTGLRPGPNRIAPSLEAGGVLRGTVVRHARVENLEVRLEGTGDALETLHLPGGAFEIADLPSGPLTVVAEGRVDGKPVRATATARRGVPVVLVLGDDE